MTVEEADAVQAMVAFAHPVGSDPSIVSGESGGVGLAGLRKVLTDRHGRAALDLNGQSRVLLFNTEGATDPVAYRRLTNLNAPTDNGLPVQ